MEPYFQDKAFTVYLGDSIEILPKIGKANMIFADPPYNLSNGGTTCRNGKRVSVNKGEWDKVGGTAESLEFTRKWIRACGEALAPGGTIWVTGTYHSIFMAGFALQEENFKILNDIAWFKPNAPPNLACRCFTASHENVIWAKRNDNSKHVFNYDEMKNGKWKGDQLKHPGKQMRSVWCIPSAGKSEKRYGCHPTQKPLALLERIITASTNKGDTILDPFCGSGTTGIEAAMLKRKFIGIEKEEEFAEMTVRRYKSMFRIWD